MDKIDKLYDEATNELAKLNAEQRSYLISYLMGGCKAVASNDDEYTSKDQKLYAKSLLKDIIEGCKFV